LEDGRLRRRLEDLRKELEEGRFLLVPLSHVPSLAPSIQKAPGTPDVLAEMNLAFPFDGTEL
jgi:hypothetical protein